MIFDTEVTNLVVKRLDVFRDSLKTEGDFRKALAQVPLIAYPIKGNLDISEDPSRLIISYLLTQQFSHVQNAYDGHSAEWYELNKENIVNFKKILTEFTNNLIKDLPKEDEYKIYDDVKQFFSKFHYLVRGTTQDTV